MGHLCVDDLERHYLGMVRDKAELVIIEEHLLACPQCVELAEETAQDVDRIRQAIITGNFDLELDAKVTPRLQLKSCSQKGRVDFGWSSSFELTCPRGIAAEIE